MIQSLLTDTVYINYTIYINDTVYIKL